MASTPDTLLRKNISQLLDSEIYSDTDIKVGTTTFKVHKAILCTQSEYFRRAFDLKRPMASRKEALTNIITLEEPDTPEVSPFHGSRRSLTDKAFYFPSFSTAISMLYDNTPEFDRSLRDLIVNVAVKKMDEENLLSNKNFNEAMANSCGFAKDLVHAMQARHESAIIWEVDLRRKLCSKVTTVAETSYAADKAVCCTGCDRVFGSKWLGCLKVLRYMGLGAFAALRFGGPGP
ncbi:uncharacterized protein IWZ02DRAFT_436721 [Phyllosticta citriasiana]|uniref:uncharacterized protein n=1 Tax=Phyllosticta citriasiana TaxID=595635 RepID=UPI0030FDF166